LTSALAAALTASLPAADTLTRYDARPGGKVRMEGTSTIHDWHAESAVIGGFLELDPAFKFEPSQAPGKVRASVEVTIPVRALKSSGGSIMDGIMYDAMKQKTHPTIKYRLIEMTLKEQPKAGGPAMFDSIGELTVSGTTNKASMVVTIAKESDTALKITGGTPIKMTDYGIQPPAPKLALGALKTGNDVTVSFDWRVVVKPAEKSQ
jgi:polyisoprenoid-binding protein YceI